MKSLVNDRLVRDLALVVANERAVEIYGVQYANNKFIRVSRAFLDAVAADFRCLVERRARAHWQKGKTLT